MSNKPKLPLVSFDTETTGVNTKTARIWQVGSATRSGEGKDLHLKNVFETPATSPDDFFNQLKNANGVFSQKTADAGGFAGAVEDFKKGTLLSLEEGLKSTVGAFPTGSIAVMQNLNFENKLIAEAYKRGEISEETIKGLSEKFANTSIDAQGKATGKLFQTSIGVKEYMREAEYTFQTKFLASRSNEDFEKYRQNLNAAYSRSRADVMDAAKTGKIATIELMDVTKTFYANMAHHGLMAKESTQLGLNIEFLAQTVLKAKEKHLASSDSFQTIQLFENLSGHIRDMEKGIITPELRELSKVITEAQPAEVNKKFVSTLASKFADLENPNKGYTRAFGTDLDFYSEKSVQTNLEEAIESLDTLRIGETKVLTNTNQVLRDTLRKYSIYEDGLEGFSRKEFTSQLLDLIADNPGSNASDLLLNLETTFNSQLVDSANNPKNLIAPFTPNASSQPLVDETMFLGKRMKKSTAGGIVLGGVALAGMMALTPKPEAKQSNSEPVFENFYDEQYLGTAFVDFRERNKRYVY